MNMLYLNFPCETTHTQPIELKPNLWGRYREYGENMANIQRIYRKSLVLLENSREYLLNIKRSELSDRMDSQNVHLIIGSVEYIENMQNIQRIYVEYGVGQDEFAECTLNYWLSRIY